MYVQIVWNPFEIFKGWGKKKARIIPSNQLVSLTQNIY